MLYNSHQQGLIIERCWLIYELVSDKLVPPDEFHIRYPSLVEFALTSGYFMRNEGRSYESALLC